MQTITVKCPNCKSIFFTDLENMNNHKCLSCNTLCKPDLSSFIKLDKDKILEVISDDDKEVEANLKKYINFYAMKGAMYKDYNYSVYGLLENGELIYLDDFINIDKVIEK